MLVDKLWCQISISVIGPNTVLVLKVFLSLAKKHYVFGCVFVHDLKRFLITSNDDFQLRDKTEKLLPIKFETVFIMLILSKIMCSSLIKAGIFFSSPTLSIQNTLWYVAYQCLWRQQPLNDLSVWFELFLCIL